MTRLAPALCLMTALLLACIPLALAQRPDMGREMNNPYVMRMMQGASQMVHNGPQLDNLIVPGVRFSAIHQDATLDQVKQWFGAKNVTQGEAHVGEGMCEPATIVFPNKPEKTMEIVWGDKQNLKYPLRVQMAGDRSIWHTKEGITLGTTAQELMKLNGAPFRFSGLGWDYGGYINAWGEKGRLEKAVGDKLTLRLGTTQSFPQTGAPDIYGDREITSDMLAPVAKWVAVNRLALHFPANYRDFPDKGEHQKPCSENAP